MKRFTTLVLSLVLLFMLSGSAWSQVSRLGNDVVWARSIDGATITLDGTLDEAVWSQAEQITVKFGEQGAMPTSGWRSEFQPDVYFDQTDAIVKFLSDTDNNQIYLAFECADSSVGGLQDWARWDGILMSVKDRLSATRPTPPSEYFYTYWYVNVDSLIVPGAEPRFIGRFGNFGDTTRTPEQRAAWDAGFRVVGGISNDDTTPDEGYVVEMRISLDEMGYDITGANGDVVELNFSIWDTDWVHSGQPERITSSRTSWQSPWNGNDHNVGRIMAHPAITVNTATLPEVGPDVRVPNGTNFAAPTIDGNLTDDMWQYAYTFHIAWDDSLLRDTYPGVGPYRSGQFQPELNGNPRPPVLDGSHATIKMFFRDNFLYLSADVNDQLVQGSNQFDRLDGVRFALMDRDSVNEDNRHIFYQLTATFDDTLGNPSAYDNLPVLIADGAAEFAMALKGATTVNDNTDVDEGYTIEMKVDLTYLNYPVDLGDHLLFGGVMLADGDSFDDPAQDYGTRTWWFRESGNGPATPWMLMDIGLTAIGDNPVATIPAQIELLGNYPNPFNPSTTIQYSVPFAGDVNLIVYNLLGQEVATVKTVAQSAGAQSIQFDADNISSGIYFYQVNLNNAKTGQSLKSQTSTMVLLK